MSGLVNPSHLPPKLGSRETSHIVPPEAKVIPDSDEKTALINALRQSAGNQSQAAAILGVSRVTVWHRMKKYGIDVRKLVTADLNVATRHREIRPGGPNLVSCYTTPGYISLPTLKRGQPLQIVSRPGLAPSLNRRTTYLDHPGEQAVAQIFLKYHGSFGAGGLGDHPPRLNQFCSWDQVSLTDRTSVQSRHSKQDLAPIVDIVVNQLF